VEPAPNSVSFIIAFERFIRLRVMNTPPKTTAIATIPTANPIDDPPPLEVVLLGTGTGRPSTPVGWAVGLKNELNSSRVWGDCVGKKNLVGARVGCLVGSLVGEPVRYLSHWPSTNTAFSENFCMQYAFSDRPEQHAKYDVPLKAPQTSSS